MMIGKIHDTLTSSQSLLGKLAQTGPLMSLLLARDMREDLLRLNRDLSTAFHTLGTGENLMVGQSRGQFDRGPFESLVDARPVGENR
jgi:hypothetical protein